MGYTRKMLMTLPVSDTQWHVREMLARWYAKNHGLYGDQGGWIKTPKGKPLAQGWTTFYMKFRRAILTEFWGITH